MLSWLVVLAVALTATDAQGDSLDMASNRRGPDQVCWDEVDSIRIKVRCTLPSGDLLLEVNKYKRDLLVSCSKNTTLVCDELQEVEPFIDKYKDTGKWNNSFEILHINRCNLSRESLACLLGVVGANGTDLAKLQEVARNLEPVHHEGLESITRLVMYNVGKGLASVPYNVLSLLPNLEGFIMEKAVVELTSETAYVLSKLTTLELYQCLIKRIPKGAFKATPEIQRLLLVNNTIEFIDVDAFEGLAKLEFLSLSKNLFTHLPGGMFRHTPNITYLNLYENKLLDLSDDVFTGLNMLKRITVSDNKAVLKLSNKTFSNLPSLYDLQLDRCFIEIIPGELFLNTTNLKKISLQGNNIKKIPNNIFKGLKLTYVNLCCNKISYLNSDVFSEQTSMTKVILSDNDLKSLPGELFSNMNSLKILDLGHNSIGFLNNDAFSEQTSMTELILSYNDLKSLPGGLFSNMKRLKILDLGHNSIGLLNKSTFKGLISLKVLSLNDNRIEHIDQDTFDSTMPLDFLVLSNNKLTISKEKNVRKVTKPSGLVSYFSPLEHLKKLRNLDLSHNNISVYCEDWTLPGLLELDLSDNDITSLPPTVFYKNYTTVDLRYNQIQQFKPPNDIPNSTEATFLVGYNPYRCDCNLYGFIHNEKLGKMFNFFIEETECAQPPELKGVKLVNLQPEELTCDVDCKTGDRMKHTSNDSNCKCVLNKYQLRIEMFCDNLPDVYPKLPRGINSIYLKLRYGTDVSSLPAEVKIVDFSSLKLTKPPNANSAVLNLTNNYLTRAPLELFERNCSVYLSNNPFDCTCGGKDDVLALNAFKILIPDYKNLTCSNGISVSNVVVEQLCAARNGTIISLSLGIIAILVITCTIVAFKYTTELRISLRKLGLWRGDVLGGEVYDAFVSFAHQDEDFVRYKLLPKLEKGKPPLKICIHYRDWVIGDYIPAQISRSVDQSRYTIIVLTRHFVESMWGRMEFQTAHAKHRVIILMLDDLSADKSLDPELRAYISMNTYVKADDPLVWERLRDAVLRRRRSDLKSNKTTTMLDVTPENGQLVNITMTVPYV